MKVFTYTEMASVFENQQIHGIRTRNRHNTQKPHIDIMLRGNNQLHQLRSTRGWKISSVLINTLLYSPVIERVETEIDGEELHYTLYAKGTYIVAEISARRSIGVDVSAYPFELVVLDVGEEYVSVLDRRNR